jgi:alkylation response protein AidB-like acyl-CoA dehydrogenase
VKCGSIEHKMGIHANSTCVINLDNAKGWLVGEPNKGLNAMFVMMNAARLGVGMQSLGLTEIGYQNSLDVREGAPADAFADRPEGAGKAG